MPWKINNLVTLSIQSWWSRHDSTWFFCCCCCMQFYRNYFIGFTRITSCNCYSSMKLIQAPVGAWISHNKSFLTLLLNLERQRTPFVNKKKKKRALLYPEKHSCIIRLTVMRKQTWVNRKHIITDNNTMNHTKGFFFLF